MATQKLSKAASAAFVAGIITGDTSYLHVEYRGHYAELNPAHKKKTKLNYISMYYLLSELWEDAEVFGIFIVALLSPIIFCWFLMSGYRYEVVWNKERFTLTRRDSWTLKKYLKKKWKEQQAIKKQELRGLASKQELELLKSLGYDVTKDQQ